MTSFAIALQITKAVREPKFSNAEQPERSDMMNVKLSSISSFALSASSAAVLVAVASLAALHFPVGTIVIFVPTFPAWAAIARDVSGRSLPIFAARTAAKYVSFSRETRKPRNVAAANQALVNVASLVLAMRRAAWSVPAFPLRFAQLTTEPRPRRPMFLPDNRLSATSAQNNFLSRPPIVAAIGGAINLLLAARPGRLKFLAALAARDAQPRFPGFVRASARAKQHDAVVSRGGLSAAISTDVHYVRL